LKLSCQKEYIEVTKEEYIQVERASGFYSKFGDTEIATASFTSGNVMGRVDYEKGD
jgi:hypothetical protein